MPRHGTRRTIERGIYKDARGYEVVARAGRDRQSVRFPADADLKEMRAWRDRAASDLRDDAQPTADARTLAGAIVKYRRVTHLKPSHPDSTALKSWEAEYGELERRKITPALAVQAFARWKALGYSPQSLYYRRLVLEKLWKTLDGPKVKTPVEDIAITRPKGRRPLWVPDETIMAVMQTLRRQVMAGRLRTTKTPARFLVLVTTGQRPAQLKLAQRGDVDLERGVWHVRAAKGGEPVPFYLNSEMRDAWRAFIRAEAWGKYDTRSFARTLRFAGWPKGVRPYNVRHAAGFSVSARGGDLGDIQLMLGHTDPSTTRVYVGAIEGRMRDVSTRLEGRFGDGSVAHVRGTPRKR